jgi:HAD superfamily hydrolase (TIGR01509 family)
MTPVSDRADRPRGNGPQVVVFDCDGVLFDSAAANLAYYDTVLAALGQAPLDAALARQAHTMAAPQLFAVLFADEPALVEQARAVTRQIDYGPFYQLMQPVPDLFDLLGRLKTTYRMAMATNRGTSTQGVVRHFGLDRFFELAVGMLDVPRPKPFPDMLEKCLVHFGLPADAAVYVGDAPSDYEAASAAGMRFIGVGDHCGAPQRIGDLRELPAALGAAAG